MDKFDPIGGPCQKCFTTHPGLPCPGPWWDRTPAHVLLGTETKRKRKVGRMRETQQQRRIVTFRSGIGGRDSKAPAQTPYGVLLRCPVVTEVAPGTGAIVRFGLSCDHPLLLTIAPNVPGLRFAGTPIQVAEPDVEVVVAVENTTQSTYGIDVGDALVRAIPLGAYDVEVRIV